MRYSLAGLWSVSEAPARDLGDIPSEIDAKPLVLQSYGFVMVLAVRQGAGGGGGSIR